MTTQTLWILMPEMALAFTAVAIYLAGAFVASRGIWAWRAGGGIVVAMALLATQSVQAMAGPVTGDALALWTRWAALAVGLLLVMMAGRNREPDAPEYVGSLLLAVVGVMLVGTAQDIVLVFLGLELVSIPTYLLLYMGHGGPAPQESTLKYFFLSVVASAIVLYGLSFLYGAAGSTDLPTIAARLIEGPERGAPVLGVAEIGLILIFAGLGFKLAAVPLHFYAPDVYQGTTHLNAAYLSVVPKAAALIALVRLVVEGMPGVETSAWRIAMAMAAVTMTYGNVVALWQTNVRRLMAYSSIAHGGYILIAVAVGLAAGKGGSHPSALSDGIAAALFYLAVYSVASVGVFAALAFLSPRGKQIDHLDELAGLGRTCPGTAAAMAVLLFSLAGIPPLAGFWGKLCVFAGALNVSGGTGGLHPWFVSLAVLGVLNAAVAAAYYLRIVGVMYFRFPLGTPRPDGGPGSWTAMILCTLLTIAIGLHAGPLLRACEKASPEDMNAPPIQAQLESD
ncbi:MAG: NADH-quinone oxidoreductase subunit N [Pirellulales bacterium]|nr:NADH-quinone oxidoreductase subunit N [Pirellulales bacterium]